MRALLLGVMRTNNTPVLPGGSKSYWLPAVLGVVSGRVKLEYARRGPPGLGGLLLASFDPQLGVKERDQTLLCQDSLPNQKITIVSVLCHDGKRSPQFCGTVRRPVRQLRCGVFLTTDRMVRLTKIELRLSLHCCAEKN
jgi:hypothetical protein